MGPSALPLDPSPTVHGGLTFAKFILVNPSEGAHRLKQPLARSRQTPEQEQGPHAQHRQQHTWQGQRRER